MSHEFTYPKVTEIRRLSLAIAGPPIRQGLAESRPVFAPPRTVKRP